MNLHRTTGRTALGLTLALLTALVWGTMPVALKVLVGRLDPYTLSWSRFLAAGLLIAPVVLRRHGASALRQAAARPLLAAVCVVGLTGNYILYQSGLRSVSPDTAQIIVQLSPVFVLIGGLVIFREPFGRLQALGFAALVAGMALFFNLRWADLAAHASAYSVGVLLVTASSVLWSGYMLAQKQLLTVMAPETILLMTYAVGAVLLLPAARPSLVVALPPWAFLLLSAVALMTLASYLSFGAAMNHLEASRIGAVIAVSPLLTVAAARLVSAAVPGAVAFERLNALALIGAVMVVAGSFVTTLARRR